MSNIPVLWFTEEACRDVRLAAGKGASLANMTAQGLPMPPGFVIPAYATASEREEYNNGIRSDSNLES